MSTVERTNAPGHTIFTPEERAELDGAIRRAMSGTRDPQAMRRARERMDRRREENRKRFGIQEVAVKLIREGRE